MEISVSTNFQDDFIPMIKKFPVKEVYGKLTEDFIGGGRPSFILPDIGRKRIEKFIKELHKNSLEFNYLLNSTCLNNQEVTKNGYNRIRRDLDWISKIQIDSVTVSISYLAKIIKQHYPQLKLKVSAFAGVRSLRQAQYWEELGADVITLEPQSINREFSLIKNIASNIKVNIQLIVNQGCLYSCPNVLYHANLFSHFSQAEHYSKGFLIDYCSIECKNLKLKEKVNFIRADWIRPEDINEYEAIGVKHFKIIQRNWPTARLEKTIEAYIKKGYEGNLADIIEFLCTENILSFSKKLKYSFYSLKNNLFGALKFHSDIKSLKKVVEIDNTLLKNFIDIFKKESCQFKNCQICRYCHTVAERVVKIK